MNIYAAKIRNCLVVLEINFFESCILIYKSHYNNKKFTHV